MPITTIDPRTALIVVDLQTGLAAYPTVHPFADIVGNAAKLAEAFRAKGLPVVLVNVVGNAPGRTEQGTGGQEMPDNWADLVPELNEQPSDKTITKYTWGAFHNTGLADHLGKLGVTQVVVCGVATAMGVESTARQAHEHGFHVAVALDAVTDVNPVTHNATATHIFPALGETGVTDEIINYL
jgi:nicotinamidase-related amidase